MEIQAIASRRNPVARQAASLAASAASRREAGAFLCEGARLCQDAARSGLDIRASFFTAAARERYAPYMADLLAASQSAYEISPPVAELLASTQNPQGVFCVCGWPKGWAEEPTAPAPEGPCLVLEAIQDPGNLGTILRTAEALGVFQVFPLGDCCDPFSPKALRASMGAAFRLGLSPWGDAEKLCKLLRAAGYTLHAAVPDGDATPVTALDLAQGRHAVFIGNEGGGLSQKTIALCGNRVTIPMAGRAESLNAGAAATILLWELTKGGGGRG